jgi:hypothetical protein
MSLPRRAGGLRTPRRTPLCGFSSYSALIRGTLRADFAVLKPAAFVILTNITPSGS